MGLRQRVILSIVSNNYGNRLQNYALGRCLENERGVSTVDFRFGSNAKAVLSNAKRVLVAVARKEKKAFLFSKFNKEHINFWHTTKDAFSEFDGDLIIGSDQCWNPNWHIGSRTDGMQCGIDVGSRSVVAYAASFGISFEQMSQQWRSRYGRWLATVSHIAMREDEGATIVERLTGCQVPVVLDPTMLLSQEEWIDVEKRPMIPGIETDRFCVKYVLGDDENESFVESVAAECNLRIIDLNEKSLPVGPAEFVWLVHHASLICTDSFHASVFSLLFHRPFVIFERQEVGQCDMSSRFDTLGRIFGVNDHRFSHNEFSWSAVWDQDWTGFECTLESERERSLSWLQNALRGIKGID